MMRETSWITEAVPLTVSVVPASSPLAALVEAAALHGGASFVATEGAGADGVPNIRVVEVAADHAGVRLGELAIAVTWRTDVVCHEIVRPDEVDRHLERAVRSLLTLETLRFRVKAERATIQLLNEIGYALSAVQDRQELLDTILTHTRAAVRADAGMIFLLEGETLRFAASQSDTCSAGALGSDLALSGDGVVALAARTGQPRTANSRLAVRALDAYPILSQVAMPLVERNGAVLGVLVLCNHKASVGASLKSLDEVTPFGKRHVDLLRSVASQAAMALENQRLVSGIRGLFDGFVTAAVSAIEARDPSTGGHSQRVARLTTLLAREVSDSDAPPFRDVAFSADELVELHYASLLHDFGKVGVREHVLLKAEKLYPWELEGVELRVRIAALEATLLAVRENAGEHLLQETLEQLRADLALVRRMNRGGRCEPADAALLQTAARRWRVRTEDGERPLLESATVGRLCIRAGTLDPEEREEIERHVVHTHRFLSIIPWTRELRNVPGIAGAHHEKLDGTGYPLGLREAEIPFGARLMAVTDIWDALTASDRPYKAAMPTERALGILRAEAAAGKIMGEAVELFAGRRLWERAGT